jgi:hypothetical protein
MDIVLERVLSLIPKDKSGKYVHGEKAKFAKSIGYNDGSIVSMWENGSSVSYTKKLHQIASTYNVSVEWLEGKTDDPAIKKERPADGEALSDMQLEAIEFVKSLPEDKLNRFLRLAKAAFEEDGK